MSIDYRAHAGEGVPMTEKQIAALYAMRKAGPFLVASCDGIRLKGEPLEVQAEDGRRWFIGESGTIYKTKPEEGSTDE